MILLILMAMFGVLVVPLAISVSRATELFVLRAKQGKLRFVRGRVPGTLLEDLDDVLRHASVPSYEIRAVRERGRAVVQIKGDLPSDVQQKVRNVVGRFQLAQLRAGRKPKRRR